MRPGSQITLIPDRGDTAGEILSWCTSNGVGIIGLGHSQAGGSLGFIENFGYQKNPCEFQEHGGLGSAVTEI